jgi:hypothetical protein
MIERTAEHETMTILVRSPKLDLDFSRG